MMHSPGIDAAMVGAVIVRGRTARGNRQKLKKIFMDRTLYFYN
jgi:hypothetical protein